MPRVVMLTLIAAHALAVVALTVAVGKKLDRPRPCRRTFEQVREGMTLAEIEAVVGAPPGNYCSNCKVMTHFCGLPVRSGVEWLNDHAELHVDFGNDSRARNVSVKEGTPSYSITRSERAREWLLTGYDAEPCLLSPICLKSSFPQYDPVTFVRIFFD